MRAQVVLTIIFIVVVICFVIKILRTAQRQRRTGRRSNIDALETESCGGIAEFLPGNSRRRVSNRNLVKSSFHSNSDGCSSCSGCDDCDRSNSSSSCSDNCSSSTRSNSSDEEPPVVCTAGDCAGGSLNPQFTDDALGAGRAHVSNVYPIGGVILDVAVQSPGVNAVLTSTHVYRIDNSGGLITSGFGVGGIADIRFLIGEPDIECNRLAVQDDGKIVIAGKDPNFGSRIIRLTSTGALDSGFMGIGVVGITISDTGPEDDYLYDVIITDAGNVVACGSASIDNNSQGTVIQLAPNGSFVGGFGNSGVYVSSYDEYTEFYGVKEDNDGRLVVVGYSGYDGLVARLNPIGVVPDDTTFGVGGASLIVAIGEYCGFEDLIIQETADGIENIDGYRILAVGYNNNSALVMALGEDGTFYDPLFGGGNSRVIKSVGFGASFYDILGLCNGGFIVAGYEITNGLNFLSVKYTVDGDEDSTFGSGGSITLANTYPTPSYSFAPLDNGTILYAGYLEFLNVTCLALE